MDDIGDLMMVMDAELGDPVAGFALLRKMVDAACGRYQPTAFERAYFDSCAEKLAGMDRKKADPKGLQRAFAQAFNLTRKRGNQRKSTLDEIRLAADIRQRMKSKKLSQDAAIEDLLADDKGTWRDFGGISTSNLKRVPQ